MKIIPFIFLISGIGFFAFALWIFVNAISKPIQDKTLMSCGCHFSDHAPYDPCIRRTETRPWQSTNFPWSNHDPKVIVQQISADRDIRNALDRKQEGLQNIANHGIAQLRIQSEGKDWKIFQPIILPAELPKQAGGFKVPPPEPKGWDTWRDQQGNSLVDLLYVDDDQWNVK